jgi:hypothetical protein
MKALAVLTFGLLWSARAGSAASYTGSLASPEDVFETTFTLAAATDIQIVTWGFGGGTNGAGTVIQSGGFDALVALFSGVGAAATIVTDSFGNPVAGADTMVGFTGNCPPAGFVTIGTGAGNSICGDVFLDAGSLPAGTYTLLLSDANYIPFAVNPGPPDSTLLSDGFSDLTGGVFQTCNMTSDGTFCVTPTANYAVDIVGASASVPEPGTLWLLAIGMAAIIVTIPIKKKQRR